MSERHASRFTERRWSDLATALGIGQDAAELDRLRAAYDEPHRHYHTVEHVEHCLAELDGVRSHLPPGGAPWIELALWYHDAVYRTRGGDSEERSADLASAFLARHGVTGERVQHVRGLILATRHDARPTGDARWVVDIDLAILGAPEEAFGVYEARIRREYAWVPGFLYRRKRRQVLRSFLDRERIYATEPFHGRLEARARANLARSLGERRAGRGL